MTYSGLRTGSITTETSPAGKLKKKNIIFGDEVNYEFDYKKGLLTQNIEPGECATLKFGKKGGTVNRSTMVKNSFGMLGARLLAIGTEYNYGITDEYGYSSELKTITSVKHKSGGNETYDYDKRKFITSYTDARGKAHRYKYDEAGRLIREDNAAMGFTKVYTYDGGNIKKVTKYPYTTAETPTGSTATYTYNYYDDGDKLYYISGKSGYTGDISYNAAGNPLQWYDNVVQWNGRKQLVSMTPPGATAPAVQCTYDAGGIRQSKNTQYVQTKYYTEGNTIHKEERSNGTTLWYYYDQSGIAAVECNGTMYWTIVK